jgi:hypothetical protein
MCAILNLSHLDPVVFGVCAEPVDSDNSSGKIDSNDEPKPITANVKNVSIADPVCL